MIDPTRWVLAEAWISLGLRLEWAPRWRTDISREQLMHDDEMRRDYYYHGGGVWHVVEVENGLRVGPRPTVPELGTEAMSHELAHYLAASGEQRGVFNFGLTGKDGAEEDRALEMEQVIQAITRACGRIAGLALQGDRRR